MNLFLIVLFTEFNKSREVKEVIINDTNNLANNKKKKVKKKNLLS